MKLKWKITFLPYLLYKIFVVLNIVNLQQLFMRYNQII